MANGSERAPPDPRRPAPSPLDIWDARMESTWDVEVLRAVRAGWQSGQVDRERRHLGNGST